MSFHSAVAQEIVPLTLEPQELQPVTVQPSSASGETGTSTTNEWTTGVGVGTVNTANVNVDSIEVNVLSTVTSDTAGLLREQDGGFPFEMWRGSERIIVDALFNRLPVATRSPAMRSLIHRLLVTQSKPPQNNRNANVLDGAFVARRLELLAAMGDSAAVTQMLDVTPGRTSNERLLRIESEAKLLRGEFIDACALTNEFMKDNMDIYWQKSFIFCQILSGAMSEAELGISLMRELGVTDELLFLILDSMIKQEIPVIESLPDPSPLIIAALSASKARLNGEILTTPTPTVLPAIAINEDVDMETRLQAAEQAVSSNVMDVSVLRELYKSVVFNPEELNSPLSTAEISSGPRARALLYQVGGLQTVDGARAESASMALERAKVDNLYAPVSEAFMTVIEGIPPRTDLMWFAGDAVRAFTLAGDNDAAQAWLGLLRSNAYLSSDAANTLTRLVPVIQLAGFEVEDSTISVQYDTLESWMKLEQLDSSNRQRSVLLFTLLENLGKSVDMSLWESLGIEEEQNIGPLPDPVIWQRLDATSRTGKIGETVTLALIMMGNGGPTTAGPLVMGHVVRVLTLNGFEDDARALSVEAALAMGL
ncbi:MAG: hypothetical protein HON65_01145 [Rhodospirillales bacterium]|nr:hypothetical protein [Rhodospirillales bacterium]